MAQDYLGAAKRYYEPTEQGVEKKIKERLDNWRKQNEAAQKKLLNEDPKQSDTNPKMNRIISGLLIAIIAFVALARSNTTAAVQALIALPGAAGLLFALWELLKANIEHQHRLEENSADNSFILSATSHMAQTAFDKHVSFCEEYLAKVDDGLGILFRSGPTEEALKIAADLYSVRRKYVVWETPEISDVLSKFEQALRKIGADQWYLHHLPVGEKRTEVVERMYETFKQVTDLKELPDTPTPEIATSYIIEQLRKHLGVSQLTALRKHYLAEAAKRLGK